MKTLKIYYKLFVLLVATISAVSCVQDDDFDTPNTNVTEVVINGTVIGIDELYGLWLQELNNNGNPVLTFEGDNQFISGYVISSDESGNFFEELVLQDAVSNPQRGVKVLIDANPLFTTYELGRKVYVKITGLTVGLDSGVLTLGVCDGNELEKIAESQMENFVIRDVEVGTIEPKAVNISDFNFTADDSDINSIMASLTLTNQYVRLSDVQFNRNDALGENRKTFAAESDDEFDGERVLESCVEGVATTFSTSTFADFKAVLLPAGRGTLDGILTLNFFGEDFNVVVNDLTTIVFDNTKRCDPDEVSCGLASSTGSNFLFSEFFETQNDGDPVFGNGWTNFVEAGSETWEVYSSGGTNASLGNSARIGSFMSGDASTIVWLVTPQIDFDPQDGETLEFKTSNSFSDGSELELLFSSDWDGVPANIPNATWSVMPDAYVVQDDDFFGDWLSSGTVDLDCVTGTGYIAWKYTGSGDADFDGTYELDEIEMRSN